MNTLTRREILQRAAYVLGGTLSVPAILGVLNGCVATRAVKVSPTWLSASDFDVVGEVADLMIPRTDTPGAKDLGVPAFIDRMLKDTYDSADRERFLAGLHAFQALSLKAYQQPFMALDSGTKTRLILQAQEEALPVERARPLGSPPVDRHFILMVKELTLLGYFTSEVGTTQALQYDPIPGAFHACVPIQKAGNGKSWALDGFAVF